jgi:hypothetical protein
MLSRYFGEREIKTKRGGPIWRWIWEKRLSCYKTISLKEWRTFLVDDREGQRMAITFMR